MRFHVRGDRRLRRVLPRLIVATACAMAAQRLAAGADISGDFRRWHTMTVTFQGPPSSETATPNPFTDYRLDVTFTGPYGQTYVVPGYYAADGNAGETGATAGDRWRVKFCPDSVGTWSYVASFVQGEKIAAEPAGGTSAGWFDGDAGTFDITEQFETLNGVDLRGKGKVEYVGGHYLRFRDGSPFIKSGSNIPETFLEYDDFDGTPPNLDYSTHVAEWREGDPTWAGGRGKGIIGALNYLSGLGVNSMYFITMNNYGDGKKSWPWTGPDAYYSYDCSKLDQWDIVFSHMDTLGMMLHVVLTETETESYFEVKELGEAGGFAPSRKIYYREMIARFGHHLAVTWNIGEENGWNDAGGYATGNTTQQRKDAADYLRRLTYYKDNITVHNGPSTDDSIYGPMLGWESLTGPEIQWAQSPAVHDKVLHWRDQSRASGHDWVVSLDEPHSSNTLLDQFRVWDVWGSYLAGAGGCEFFQTGDLSFDDFHLKEDFYRTVASARKFIEANVPCSSMEPADGLLSGAAGYVLASPGRIYLAYLTAGGAASLDLTAASGSFDVRWFDPILGGALQAGTVASVTGGGVQPLGLPPHDAAQDWAVLVGTAADAPGEASAVEPMRVTRFDPGTGDITVSHGVSCFAMDYDIVYGPLSGVSTYEYTGRACALGDNASATFNPGPDSVYWIVVGVTATYEGSYGKSSNGFERPEATGLAWCDLPQSLAGGCP